VRSRGYSLLMVLMLLGLLGVAVGGVFAIVVRGAQTSGAMVERRRSFYACDGMGRQLAALGQAFLSRNTLEDVPESVMQAELRAFLPRITPPGFEARPTDLVIPERQIQEPAPVEMITTGPFAGLEVKLQTIDMRFQAKRTASGAVCRAEQTLSLGRIGLFQFFAFSDLPLIETNPPGGDLVFLRGRIHSNGRLCMGGAPIAISPLVTGPHAVRLDARITAVERILHSADGRCGFGGGNVGIVGQDGPGQQPVGGPDRLFDDRILEPLRIGAQSGCTNSFVCKGGWRSFALRGYLGRVQDTDHEVQELTLPVDPPVRFTQVGWHANGGTVLQQMSASTTRPNTRFLVEPVLATRDPPGFSRNKMASKAQIRIIDGVWYVKDPGENNAPEEVDDDGPWPGIPIWSDHPGEYTTNTPAMTTEGVEGARPLEVGQSDIRQALERSTDPRLEKAQWSKRRTIGASPTPRRFSYYAFVDRAQADDFTNLNPEGQGLQYGRVRTSTSGNLDVDPPAVVSYGGIAPIGLAGQSYWVPGVRVTDRRLPLDRTLPLDPVMAGWCGSRTDAAVSISPVADNMLHPAVPGPVQRVTTTSTNSFGGTTTSISFIPTVYPAPSSPLPSDGTDIAYASGDDGSSNAALCANDRSNDARFRRRMRLALLESTRTGFRDTNVHGDTVFPNPVAPQPDILPVNMNLHALQEALADRTPGELGSFFCAGCLWESFDGTVYVTNTWQGSMLSQPFPDGRSSPPPSPLINDRTVLNAEQAQPRAPREDASTMGPLPYALCAANSDESARAHAQVVGHRFVEADEINATTGAQVNDGFAVPFAANAGQANTFRRIMLSPGDPTVTGGGRLVAEKPPTRLHLPTDLTTGPMLGSFNIPNCALYSLVDGPLRSARPTALRLINARTLNFNRSLCGNAPCQPVLSTTTAGAAVTAAGTLKDGLNIVSNVPVYVVGDVNKTSEIVNVQTGIKATDWIPFMIAGDTITTMSNAWSDHSARWGVFTGDFSIGPRRAATTQYNMLLLTGLAGAGVHSSPGVVTTVARSGGGLPGSMRLMEDWRSAVHAFRGSIVLGWMPVYTQWRVAGLGDRSAQPPLLRDWQFDRHLNATINQPPDSPVFDVTALRSWRRE